MQFIISLKFISMVQMFYQRQNVVRIYINVRIINFLIKLSN